jgi:hypothetical protein
LQVTVRIFLASWLAFSVVTHAASPAAYDTAHDAWQRGDYIAALNGFIQILNGPRADEYFERIALLTGELYRTAELTADGRAGRFSRDGRYILYETGLEASRRTRIVRNDHSRQLVAELAGVSAVFNADSSRLAYLKINETPDIVAAARAVDTATLTQPNRSVLAQTLTWTIRRDSSVVVRDMATGVEMRLETPSMLKTALTFAADNRTVLFLGTREGNETRTDIYAIGETDPGPTLFVDAGGLKNAPMMDPAGNALVYVVPNVSPLRKPQEAASESSASGPSRVPPPSTFAIVDLRANSVSVVAGTSPALSRDGRTLAYVARDGADYSLMVGPTTGLQMAVRRTPEPIDAPALSPDGRRIAWQMKPRDDWEIFVAEVADSGLKDERRVTHEIQDDVLPRFLDATHLVALIGEPRHRRAFLYDVAPAAAGRPVDRVRLFHNNTVRTIAPEYQWASSPEGTRLVIGAERDGDTVSPARGVYVVDLEERVTRAELVARLRANLQSETALKAASVRAFQPIAADVRQTVGRVSIDRLYNYERALFDLDSKHISRVGNHLAAQFLFDSYASFGYKPEYQWFDPAPEFQAFGGRTANIVATLPGTTNPEIVYVVSSHYDSVDVGPGADDDASGTAALLEAARVLAGHPLPATVVFASVTGEEVGLLGSREFVRRAAERRTHVAAAINNDMIGWTNDARLDNTIRYSNAGIRDVLHGAAMLFTKLITYDALYWKGTDAMSFFDAYGDVIGGIGSYPVLGSPHYHQPSDVLETVNHQLVAETAKTTVATIMLLASSPSRIMHLKLDTDATGALTASWTPGPERGITSYVVAYGPPASPLQHRLTATAPHAVLPPLAAGTVVSVKAVNAHGLEGWDWARTTVSTSRVHRPTQ